MRTSFFKSAFAAVIGAFLLFTFLGVNVAFAEEGPGTSFAVYSEDDTSLNFYHRDTVPSTGEQFEGKTATAVYTDFEDKVYGVNASQAPGWRDYRLEITSITVVDEGVQPQNMTWYFYSLCRVKTMDLAKLDASKVKSIRKMCSGCFYLEEIDISCFDTSTFTETEDLETFIAAFGLCKITIGDKWNWTLDDEARDIRLYECPEGEYKGGEGLHVGELYTGYWTDGENTFRLGEIPTGKAGTYWWQEVTQYAVNYDANGGTFSDGETQASETLFEHNSIQLTQEPTKNGKLFAGWYTNSECSDDAIYDINAEVTADLNLYARWVDEGTTSYKVSFDTTVEGVQYKTVIVWPNSEGKWIVKKPATTLIVEAGCQFDGDWQFTDNGQVLDWNFSNNIADYKDSLVNGELALKAKNVSDVVYKITYQGLENGDTNPNLKTEFTRSEATIELLDATTTRAMVFGGWLLDGQLASSIEPSETLHDVTLTARWYKNIWEASDFTYSEDGATVTGVVEDMKEKIDYLPDVTVPSKSPAGVVITGIGDGIYHCGTFGYERRIDYKNANGEWDYKNEYHPARSVTIPETVKSLGVYSMAGLTGTEITLPSVLESIGDYAFQQTNLTSIYIPDSVTSLGAAMFTESHNLTSCHLPSGIKEIPSSMFKSCEALSSIEIPKTVTAIDAWAFAGTFIKEVNFPEGLTTIGEYAFFNHQLENIDIPGTVTMIGDSAFRFVYDLPPYDLPTLKSLTLHEGLQAIGKYTFGGTDLTEVHLPTTVSILHKYAFYDGNKGLYGDVKLWVKDETQLVDHGNFTAKGVGHYTILEEEEEKPDTTEMYRLYNQWTGEHLFTVDSNEATELVDYGWVTETNEWKALKSGEDTAAVYRLYNPYSGDHHYTMSAEEYETCGQNGWRQEGIVFYSNLSDGKVDVYRLFNPFETVGTHLYTSDLSEYERLGTIGWVKEACAWYGVKA